MAKRNYLLKERKSNPIIIWLMILWMPFEALFGLLFSKLYPLFGGLINYAKGLYRDEEEFFMALLSIGILIGIIYWGVQAGWIWAILGTILPG